ncbi:MULTISPECIES: metal ABC transporter permease [Jonquetella]|uniref:ABC-type Mn2+/Zn2+ transport system, permease component n=1 Tax=Jonquetella anthropi DSM 22815 TaxID=885272 RepID=H0UIX9_9BACT|nr:MULTISPECIES: metal ABC transporter permease [Jonquetella]EEX49008.1 ABC 3 transport family protein [Jonquetella anthropi E3_33 E1]EHM12773.1 ABC-type Mn2+/Zn2+ transport system, permease component [Jonquetella anthropi DSM 22815]ERL23443.1 ABC 3 transport family protein [Jonquetella sp. BV3C21]
MIQALITYQFLRHALFAALLSSLVCGLLGPVVVIRRQVMLVGGIAHGAFGGIGLARFLGLPPRGGAYAFTLLLAGLAARLSWERSDRSDTLMGILWSAGMAVGLIFNDLTPGYGADVMSYLFGSILTVSSGELFLLGGLSVLLLAFAALRYHQLEAFLFDETFAATRGLAVRTYHCLTVAAASLAVVAIIRVVGLILVIALFTIPPYIAERHARSLAGIMGLSVVLGAAFSVAGLWFSYRFDLTAGPAIIAVACAAQAADLLIFRSRHKRPSGGRSLWR